MIYLGLEVSDYRQLRIISFPVIRMLEDRIESTIKQNDMTLLKSRQGFYLLGMGDEAAADPKDVLDAAFQLYAVLKQVQEELFGFTILLAVHEDLRPASVEPRIRAAMLAILEEEGIWIHAKDVEFFKSHAQFGKGDQFYRIVRSKKAEPVFNIINYIPQIRKKLIMRLVQFFLAWFSRRETSLPLVLVTGLPDIAKREITLHALLALIGKERGDFLQIIEHHDRFHAPFFPFVRSMKETKADVLKRVPRYLFSYEKAIWKRNENFLKLLCEGKPDYSDHAEDDFFIVYGLYLTAYFRMMEELHLPGILVFNNPEHIPSSLLGRLKKLFCDLGRRFQINVIVVSSKREVPEAFRGFQKTRITVNPFGVTDIRRCFTALYPGLRVPLKVIQNIERLSHGRYTAILHFIYYLRLSRKISQDGNRFVWVPRSELKVRMPVRPRTAALTIIKSLKEEAKTILFVASRMNGLLTDVELNSVFSLIGLNIRKVEEQLEHLSSMRLIEKDDRPRFALLACRVLSRLSPQKTKYLEEQMARYCTEKIRQFLPLRAGACFRFLDELKERNVIVDHCAEIIHYYLDARRFDQAHYFLAPENSVTLENLSGEKKKQLEYAVFTASLRFHLLSGDVQTAVKHIERSTPPTDSLAPSASFAGLYLELGRYHLCMGDTGKAIPFLKKAMHYFQELSMSAQTGESFLELGRGFLAKGNLKEALDYFSFSKKLMQEYSSPLVHVRSLWFESVTLYCRGNYSHILSNCDEAMLMTSAHGLHDQELLFSFLKARVMFDLGFYERACHFLQECLLLAELYGTAQAKTTLYAWLARSQLYLGHANDALGLLKLLDETDEVLLFRGEAHYFRNEFKKAEKVFVKALNLKQTQLPLHPEYVEWKSGFALIEGQCLDLNANGTPVRRLARAFRAVTQCRTGALEEGVAELHALTINEKFSSADPHVYFFYFLYYTILKTLDKKKTDLAEFGHALTILNKSLKHLQERSAVIDEPRDRIHYMTQNYWNKIILEEGKGNKLL